MTAIVYIANLDSSITSETEVSLILKDRSKNWNINKLLSEILSEMTFKSTNLEALFDFMELNSYIQIKAKVPNEYKSRLPNNFDISNFLNLIGLRKNKILNKKHLIEALRRLISRYLTVSNLNPNQRLADHLMYDDIWDSAVAEEEEVFDPENWICKNFPKDLLLAHSVSLYENLINI